MDRKTILWIIIILLILALLYVVFFQGPVSQTALSAGQSAGQQAAGSYGGMVGDC